MVGVSRAAIFPRSPGQLCSEIRLKSEKLDDRVERMKIRFVMMWCGGEGVVEH